MATASLPQRIVCLTEEPTEVLYALGEERRIVGISGFTVRPARARKEKPRVSAFTSAKIDAILGLKPDLAIGFSDLQADIAQTLIKHGVEVWISNHRSVDAILGYVRRLAAMVGADARGRDYAEALQRHVDDVRTSAARLPRRPKVYFEEWDDPQISAIAWVSELIDQVMCHTTTVRRITPHTRKLSPSWMPPRNVPVSIQPMATPIA